MLSTLLFSMAVSTTAHLPPLLDWQGQSESLFQPHNQLATEFESSNGLATASYQDTLSYIDKLVPQSKGAFKRVEIGQSSSGKPIIMLVASENGRLPNNKPTILLQAGIHAGEIDGKDATLMMLRDIVQGQRNDILSRVNILFIPILNVDGHQRSSQFNRMNQRGPHEMGFRTNGVNLNLNRDFTKLETPEVRAVLSVINQYKPDLYVDLHVTDGADYEYDITYGFSPEFASNAPQIAAILAKKISPIVNDKLTRFGHVPGPLVFVMDKNDISKGLAGWVASPRFSNGWGDLANVPTILLENHSLKPYKQRVLGTYVFIDGVIDALALHHKALSKAVSRENEIPLRTLVVERSYSNTPVFMRFKGIDFTHYPSELSGQQEVKYLGKRRVFEKMPVYWQKDHKHTVKVPVAYYLPKTYNEVASKLQLHGIKLERVYGNLDNLQQAFITDYEFSKVPFEGRMGVKAKVRYEKVSPDNLREYYKVSTAQPRGKLAVHLLQPEALDSFFQWGYFNTTFQRTEYVENYALLPFVENMFENSPQLKAEFEKKLLDEAEFKNDPKLRRDWLYKQTPFYDNQYLKYPVLIEY